MSDGTNKGRRADDLASALESMTEIIRRLDDRQPAIFLDYDGTLTPIVSQPEDATLSDGMREVLSELSRTCTVAIVSGRDRADVEPLVGLDGLVYAGSHGYDIKGPGGLRMEYEGGREALPELESAEGELKARLGSVPGARVERKRFAIANHYRNVAEEDVDGVEEAVRQVAEQHPRLRVSGGKKVFELRPDIDWDKGRAVLWLLEMLGLDDEGVLPFYVGDDVTDEDAFRALAGGGVGVIVGTPSYETFADYRLRNTDEVREFLAELVDQLRGGS